MTDTERVEAIRTRLLTTGYEPNSTGAMTGDMVYLLSQLEDLLGRCDRLAKIASSAAVILERGKRDLMAHGWKVATEQWLTRGDLYDGGPADRLGRLDANPFLQREEDDGE